MSKIKETAVDAGLGILLILFVLACLTHPIVIFWGIKNGALCLLSNALWAPLVLLCNIALLVDLAISLLVYLAFGFWILGMAGMFFKKLKNKYKATQKENKQ